jgi:acetyl esterase
MKVTRRQVLATALAVPLAAQNKAGNSPWPYPPRLEGAVQETYKRTGAVTLHLWVYTPAGHRASQRRAGIVFFFGGGWRSGSPAQFEPQCKHLASRGMVAITADYRVASRHDVPVVECVRDAKSAVRWVRTNAARLGIDAARLAAGGGSAGGHLAAATGVVEGLDEAAEDGKVSSKPNALVLFNPVLITADAPEAGMRRGDAERLVQRFGTTPESLSPYHHVKTGAPPALILHGKADTTVPYPTAEAFTKKMQAAGNRCELEGYEGQPHGFFNYRGGENVYYDKTLQRADAFLVSLGYLQRG